MFTPFRHDLKPRAKKLRKEMTGPEKKLWFSYLRHLPEKFLRQKPIGNCIVDFYCAQKKLVVEVDGETHFLSEEIRKKDCERDRILREEYSLRVVRVLNDDVLKNFEAVCEGIAGYLRD